MYNNQSQNLCSLIKRGLSNLFGKPSGLWKGGSEELRHRRSHLSKNESDIDIENYLQKQKSLIDIHLKKIFEESSNYIEPKELWDAVRYSLTGGKRIRGIFCISAFEAIAKENVTSNILFQDCLTTACSLELSHSMSLIHDDLPSMDNDDLRRGRPSCHKKFGEATAILAGDAMLSLSFKLITNYTKEISPSCKTELINILTNAFSFGLVPGQILDLSNSSKSCDLKTVENIYRLKTAELIKASLLSGATIALGVSGDTKDKILKSLSNFGLKTGIAFQIIDDILDITTDTKTLGKTSGKDEKQKKTTYPAIIGIEKSKKMADNLISEAKSELKTIPINTLVLSSLADYIINRIY